MNDYPNNQPRILVKIIKKSKEIGFTMPSDLHIGCLLKTLVLSKPGGRFLELGTGIGLSLAWMVDGMDAQSHLVSVDNDEKLTGIVEEFFKHDLHVEIICRDGAAWLGENRDEEFDLIFADTWPGKYELLDETLHLLKTGGFYVLAARLTDHVNIQIYQIWTQSNF